GRPSHELGSHGRTATGDVHVPIGRVMSRNPRLYRELLQEIVENFYGARVVTTLTFDEHVTEFALDATKHRQIAFRGAFGPPDSVAEKLAQRRHIAKVGIDKIGPCLSVGIKVHVSKVNNSLPSNQAPYARPLLEFQVQHGPPAVR